MAYTDDDKNWLIEELSGYNNENLIEILKKHKIRYSGHNKSDLLKSIKLNLMHNTSSIDTIINYIDEIEEHGNQHVYLYKCNNNYLKQLASEEYVKKILTENGVINLYNNSKVVFLPEKPVLSSVKHDKNQLKFKWVVKKESNKLVYCGTTEGEFDKQVKSYLSNHLEDGINSDDELEIKISRKLIHRSITIFSIDLISGYAELKIHKLHSGSNYSEIQQEYLNKLEKFIDVDHFEGSNITSVFGGLSGNKDILTRKETDKVIRGGTMNLTSSNRKSGIRNDKVLNRAKDAVKDEVYPNYGSYYFEANGTIKKSLHVTLYQEDNRIGIHRICDKPEVDYVLSRIRDYT